MKMLFFSSERAEVELVRTGLLAAGVACEVRENGASEGPTPMVSAMELWIKNDGDSHRAVMLCVELGVGFAKRPAMATVGDEPEEQDAGW